MTDGINYRILGEEMQCVEMELAPKETVVAESGGMMYMETGIQMQTIFGDGSVAGSSSIFDKVVNAGKRLLTGESLFMTSFTNMHSINQKVSFASPYPGKIIALDLAQLGGKIVCQKDAFLCSVKGNSIGLEFQRKLGTGLFGGEGFIMQKIEGRGLAFMHAGGYVMERTLSAGEILRVDTGCLVGFTQGINYDIQMVRGIKNAIFGGEGLFLVQLSGSGKVWLQTLPVSRLASRILQYGKVGGKEEGSLLGGVGKMLSGDNF